MTAAEAERRSAAPAPTAPEPPGARRPLAGRQRYAVCVGVAGIWALLDQATKVLAVEHLTGRGAVDAPLPGVEWQLLYNENAAFGIPGFTGMFVLVTVAVLALVGRALPRTDRLSLAFAYGLVCGGAIGNGLDRVFRQPGFPDGGVVDFVSIGWWPTFNVADIGIVTGAALIVLLLMLSDREARRREEHAARRTSVRPGAQPPQGVTGGAATP